MIIFCNYSIAFSFLLIIWPVYYMLFHDPFSKNRIYLYDLPDYSISAIFMIYLTTLYLLSLWSTYLLYICYLWSICLLYIYYLYDLPDYSISVISMICLTTLFLLSLWFVLYCLLRNYVLWAEFPATREKLVNFLKPPQPWISPYSPLLLNLSPYSPLFLNLSPYSPLLLNLSPYSPLLLNLFPYSPLLLNLSLYS